MLDRIPRRPLFSFRPWLSCGLAALSLAPLVSAQTAPPATSRPYTQLTNTSRSVTNFNVEVVRGFVVRPDLSELFAINAYESSIVRHQFLPGTPGNPPIPANNMTHHWRTVTNPVSIAFVGLDGLLVVGQGTHALVRHDTTSGAIVDYLQLGSEPADIAVEEENNMCWVSCMGDDSVYQIQLSPALTLKKVWNKADGLRLKRPRFLYLDHGKPANLDDNLLYVAPLVSGNNTLPIGLSGLPTVVVDPDGLIYRPFFTINPAFGGRGLEDFDLFRIRTTAPVVEPVVRGAGSLILGHAFNPATNEYWMLNVQEENANPNMNTEPALRGRFAANRLSIVSLPSTPAMPVPPSRITDLDNTLPGSVPPTYVPQRSLSFPYALEIDPATGWGFVAGSTTPNIALIDPSGTRSPLELPLTNVAGTISGRVARTLVYSYPYLFAYCQETSNILVWWIFPLYTQPVLSISVGNDPTPAPVKRGRSIWYDATPSLDGRTSCNTCHPQGGADGLAWPLSGSPVDHKSVMVTQTLMGIEDAFPYHWRGERDLAAFNDAFPGLLGHTSTLSPTDLDDLIEFCFSLTPQANPAQALSRQLDDAPAGTPAEENGKTGDVTDGDFWYHNLPSTNLLGLRTCVSCHADPTGSNGDVVPDFDTRVASDTNLEATQLDNQLTLKDQPLIDVLIANIPFKFPLLGAGFRHNGTARSLFNFVDAFGISAQQKADITSFVKRFDFGIAPAAHYGARLVGNDLATEANINTNLLTQATSGGIGCIAFGTIPVAGTPQQMSWYYDSATALFVPADPTVVGPQALANFRVAGADNVFLGVPPGNEKRLGVDFDNDGLSLRGELNALTNPWNPDSDGDGWPDGYEVAQGSNPLATSTPTDTTAPSLVGSIALDFVNATQAKFHFTTTEPTRWSISCSTLGGPTHTDSRQTFDTIHTALVQKLEPSTSGFKTNTFRGTLTLTDRGGNTRQIPLPAFDSASLVHDGTLHRVVVGGLAFATQTRGTSNYSAQVDLRIDRLERGPTPIAAPGQVVVGQLLKEVPNPLAPNDPDWIQVPAADIVSSTATATGFSLGGFPYGSQLGDVVGPYLVLNPTTAAGLSSLQYNVRNLTSGQKVMFNILMILPAPTPYHPGNPIFPAAVPNEYAMPSTLADLRKITSTI